MDALARAKAERAGHRGIVTKAINDVNQYIGNPADLQDIATVTEQLHDCSCISCWRKMHCLHGMKISTDHSDS